MATILLGDGDFDDLKKGRSVTVIGDDGDDVELDRAEFSAGDLDALEAGAELFIGDHRVSYPD